VFAGGITVDGIGSQFSSSFAGSPAGPQDYDVLNGGTMILSTLDLVFENDEGGHDPLFSASGAGSLLDEWHCRPSACAEIEIDVAAGCFYNTAKLRNSLVL
jgi:hypothetical protein